MLLFAGAAAWSHELPERVQVSVFVKPDGNTLRVLVRVPLEAMRDQTIPTRGPGYLDLAAADPVIRDAATLWLGDEMRFFEDGRELEPPRLVAARVSLPSSRAFGDYASALAHVTGEPLAEDTELYWEQGLLDALFEADIGAADADFATDLDFAQLGGRTVTVLRFLGADGGERMFRYEGDPGRVALDPGWLQAGAQFVGLGFRQVLQRIDHLLFVFCLVIPFRRFRPLVVLVTAFTLAHSLTLTAAALGMAPQGGWFPPLVEALIAVSIVYLALENLLGPLGWPAPTVRRRWLAAFGFGMVHGFGFAFVLGDSVQTDLQGSLQFAGSHLLVSLAAFNVGIELGQLLVVAAALGLLALVFRGGVPEGLVIIVASVLVAHTAWHWMLERSADFLAYSWTWPSLDAAWWAGALRWLMLLLVAVGMLWLLNLGARRWLGEDAEACAGKL